jgi:hypothetical protein
MCFSATASMAMGVALCGVGIACLASAPSRRSLAFAAFPLCFGLQQLTEWGVWTALERGDGAALSCSTSAFSFLAEIFWPIYAPFAVWLIEPEQSRRRAMAACIAVGAAVASALLYGLIDQPVAAELQSAHIAYHWPHYPQLGGVSLFVPTILLYLTAVCLSLMLSSDRLIRWIGGSMLASFVVTYLFYQEWLISVWCFFAAGLSALVWIWVTRLGVARPPLIPTVRTS